MAVVVNPGLDQSENISENQGEGVQDSGETGHAVWFRDSVTKEETGVRARGSRAEDVEVLFGSDKGHGAPENTADQLQMSSPASVFPVAHLPQGTGRLVRIKGKMNAAVYRDILDENLLQNSLDLRLGRRFIFQQDNDPKHTAKITKE
ncbi:hypothetical protein QTP86_004109 [Hemibagrus guttatus]|nr:hypothetical protein QTP86_004109 [Hemibagrus guttatus]